MGYYSDFIHLVAAQRRLIEDVLQQHQRGRANEIVETNFGPVVANKEWLSHQVMTHMPFQMCADAMLKSKIVRMRHDQTAIFLDLPTDPEQDYLTWFRLPFKEIYIQPDQPVRFRGYVSDEVAAISDEIAAHPLESDEHKRLHALMLEGDPHVRGMIIEEVEISKDGKRTVEHPSQTATSVYTWRGERLLIPENVLESTVRVIVATFLMPIPKFDLNIHGISLAVQKDNTLTVTHLGDIKTRVRMANWLVHTVNFLSSPSVKLLWNPPPAALNKKREKRGNPPLPGWYEITYRKHIKEYSKAKISEKAWEHSFRYDVRGHMARFKKGRMAGRVIWIPPHQRGLRHALYKPKTYREPGVGGEEGTPLWTG